MPVCIKFFPLWHCLVQHTHSAKHITSQSPREWSREKCQGGLRLLFIMGPEARGLMTTPGSQLFSHSVLSESLRPHGLQHARPPCPSPTPVYPNPCPLSRWCHPTISSSVIPFSSCPQSFPASESFPKSWLSASGGQSIGGSASASVLLMNIQGSFHLGLNGLG